MDDWEYSDKSCPRCGADMATRSCSTCGGEGEVEDDDGINGFGYETCDDCRGKGYDLWCRECGWDAVFKHFLSPKLEAEWKAKQYGRIAFKE